MLEEQHKHEVVKATRVREPIGEPAQSVPKEVMEDVQAKKAGLKPLKVARNSRARPDQGKSNTDRQGYQKPTHIGIGIYKTKKYLPFCMDQA